MLTVLALAIVFHPGAISPAHSPVELSYSSEYLAPIVINVDAKDGDSISGSRAFKVTVNAGDAIVTRVEEYVNDQLVTSQTSTPYLFSVNTLLYDDGPIKIKFVAYTDGGKQETKTLKLIIANGVSKGAPFHVKQGTEDFQNGDYDKAILEGLIALKADKDSVPAKLLLARSYLLENAYPKAQAMVEDILSDHPNNLDALNIAGTVGVNEAFNIYSSGKNSADALNTIADAFKYAVKNRKAYLNGEFDSLSKNVTDSKSAIAYAASACAANHFSDAIQVLNNSFAKNESETALANWLVYAQLRAGRVQDAFGTLKLLKNAGNSTFDGYTQAINAVLLTMSGQNDMADNSMSNALLSDMSSLGVRTAQASIALQENKTKDLAGMLNSLVNDAGQLTEVNYLVSCLEYKTQNYSQARQYMLKSLQVDPANYLMYVEAGNQVLDGVLNSSASNDSRTSQYKVAQMFFQTALLAKGDSYEALTGLSIISGLQGNASDALKYAQAAVAAQPNYAGGEYALSMAYGMLTGSNTASNSNTDYAALAASAAKQAATLDPTFLAGVPSPSPVQCWTYFSTNGRTPIISPPPMS